VKAVLGVSAVLALLLLDWGASGVAFTLAYGIAWAALAVVLVDLALGRIRRISSPLIHGSSSFERTAARRRRCPLGRSADRGRGGPGGRRWAAGSRRSATRAISPPASSPARALPTSIARTGFSASPSLTPL
jgi:hypothetical protein